jgi:hypothetical protein
MFSFSFPLGGAVDQCEELLVAVEIVNCYLPDDLCMMPNGVVEFHDAPGAAWAFDYAVAKARLILGEMGISIKARKFWAGDVRSSI